MRRKKGSSVLAVPIMFVIVTVMLIVIFYFLISITIPLVYYDKIDNIVTKYMFIVEKFGYLTNSEKNQMLEELINSGLDKSNITLVFPDRKIGYGQPIELSVSYRYIYKLPILNSNLENKKETIISVKKNSFSKIY